MPASLGEQITDLWEHRDQLSPADADAFNLVRRAIDLLDRGEARVEFARHALDPYDERMFVDQGAFARSERPAIDARAFDAPDERQEVFADGPWRVSSRQVEHGAILPAVAYRIETARITVCVSGDTRVCAGVEDLAQRADVLVHEAIRAEPLEAAGFGALLASNADAAAVGALARRCEVRLLALTHLIPPPSNENDEHAFEADVRGGGYTGPLIVGRDLARCAPGTLLGD